MDPSLAYPQNISDATKEPPRDDGICATVLHRSGGASTGRRFCASSESNQSDIARSFQVGEPPFEGLVGAVEARRDSACGTAEHVGDLIVAHALGIPEDDHDSHVG